MSETQEGYGAQSTPDMGESYPPQTGDLLGSYIARLSARVRELEGTLARFLTAVENANSYQADYGHRIVKLETADRLTHARMNSLCQEQNDLEQRLRVTELEPHAVTTLEEDLNYEPLYPACENCGHAWADHDEDHKGEWCKLCSCIGYKNPIPTDNTPTVTRERTHGRYGTRNLTKSKPDHIVDANKKVCATCGHDKISHTRGYVPGVTEPVVSWCHSGTLGKPCKCTAFKPVVSEG